MVPDFIFLARHARPAERRGVHMGCDLGHHSWQGKYEADYRHLDWEIQERPIEYDESADFEQFLADCGDPACLDFCRRWD